jgi:hypothetical protein
MNQPQKGRMRPNTFPTPNEHVDLAMEMLTPEEYKVLNFAIRHTWGWHVDQKAISITTFTHGYGPYRGVGMSRSTVLKCLSELSRLEFLVPMGKADADGQVWAVGLDPNIDALEQRYNEKKQKSQEIMSPIRAKKGKSKTAVYDTDRSVTQTDSGLSGRPTAVYGIDAIKDNPKDTSKDRKEKETTLSASAESAVSPVNDWSIADEADDAAMFVPKGKKQISAQAEKGSKRLSKPTTTPTPPQPLPAPAPVAVDDVERFSGKLDAAKGTKGKGNRMAHIIDTAWRKSVSGFLLPQLMGKADKPDRKPYNISPACSEAELWAFGNWWRRNNPKLNMPTKGNAVHDAILGFRGEQDYERRVEDAEYDVGKLFPRGDAPKVETAPAPEIPMATPEQIAQVSASFDRLVEAFTRQDVS